MSGWSRVVIVEKFSILFDCPFPDPLAGESKSLLLLFCLSICLFVLSGCQIFHSKPGIHRVKGKAREVTFELFLRFQCPYLVCLLSTFQSLLVVVVYLLTRVFSVLNASNREKYIYSIFLEVESTTVF